VNVGESAQHGSANVGESGESAQHGLAIVGESGQSQHQHETRRKRVPKMQNLLSSGHCFLSLKIFGTSWDYHKSAVNFQKKI
jgi:hypothetical protein